MAVRATGLTKFLAASKLGTKNPAESASTRERSMNREYRIIPIIRWEHRPLLRRRFRMAQLELPSLQSGAGGGIAAEPALLALPDFAPRQVPHRVCCAHRTGSCTRGNGKFAAEASHLGSCGFRG